MRVNRMVRGMIRSHAPSNAAYMLHGVAKRWERLVEAGVRFVEQICMHPIPRPHRDTSWKCLASTHHDCSAHPFHRVLHILKTFPLRHTEWTRFTRTTLFRRA